MPSPPPDFWEITAMLRKCVLGLLLFCLAVPLVADDDPGELHTLIDPANDGRPAISKYPATQEWEAVWPKRVGGQLEIAHAIKQGDEWRVTLITNTPEDEERPRLAFDSFGDTIIVWEAAQALPQVYASIRGSSSETYLAPARISHSARISHLPDVAVLDDVIFLVQEVIDPDGRMNLIVHRSTDNPGDRPAGGGNIVDVGRVQNDRTPATANTFPRLHVEQGVLWLTWTQSPVEVGYQVWNGQTLSPPATVRYGHTRSKKAAFREIRCIVLGLSQEEDEDDD